MKLVEYLFVSLIFFSPTSKVPGKTMAAEGVTVFKVCGRVTFAGKLVRTWDSSRSEFRLEKKKISNMEQLQPMENADRVEIFFSTFALRTRASCQSRSSLRPQFLFATSSHYTVASKNLSTNEKTTFFRFRHIEEDKNTFFSPIF